MISKIAIVVCYFGKFPWYFHYFLHSCRYNPTVDFYIITDNEDWQSKTKNVFFIRKQLKDIEEAATKKLGFNVDIPYPYKLCDIKPAYGLLFSDILKDYDFWGHSDLDIVYGDIREFMTEALLAKYDIISVRHDYVTGTFALFRNNKKMNLLFKQSRDYKKVFSNANHFCFDECNFLWEQLEEGKSIEELPYEIESMTHVVRRLIKKNYLRAHFDFLIVEGAPGRIKWVNGKILYKNRYEAMLYHLIIFRTKCKKQTIFKNMPNTICFSEKSIYKRI